VTAGNAGAISPTAGNSYPFPQLVAGRSGGGG
jgi:hypothetical protein